MWRLSMVLDWLHHWLYMEVMIGYMLGRVFTYGWGQNRDVCVRTMEFRKIRTVVITHR